MSKSKLKFVASPEFLAFADCVKALRRLRACLGELSMFYAGDGADGYKEPLKAIEGYLSDFNDVFDDVEAIG